MAKVQNTFLKSKMNKDLDARLIPNGEYRNAVNAQISRSEGEGVGTLENILGNEVVANIEPSISNLTAIGHYVDQINNYIYIFLTDNSVSTYVNNGSGSNHFIYRYNEENNTATKLVEGAFLNFSKLNPIYGINLLENLLFFTDNRNQPRKINVTNAVNNSNYYYNEDQISVAKYNPFNPMYLYRLNASVSEYESTMKDVVSKFLPTGGSAIVSSGGTNTNTFTISGGVFEFYPNKPAQGQTVGKITTPGGPITILSGVLVGAGSTTSQVVLNTNINLQQNDELVFFPNPYYNPDYSGDSAFLEDKFVRFSYRFKFEDNEYSLIAPFTQNCFIPKQDGYFLTKGPTSTDSDQSQAVSSSIVSFVENKVNSIALQIPLPYSKSTLADKLKVSEIDILYKESDGLSIKVIETIPLSSLSGSSDVLEYLYTGKKPFKTLLEKEISRVYDKVPVKALAQEVSGNRIIYSNFQNRHTPPEYLDYNVAITDKTQFSLKNGSAQVNGAVSSSKSINIDNTSGTIEVGQKVYWSGSNLDLFVDEINNPPTSIVVSKSVTIANNTVLSFSPVGQDRNNTTREEYPSSSLKTNRSYQVGVVLSDRYGRTSDVILSNNNDIVSVGGQNYSGPSLYSEYIDESKKANDWPGNSLKVLFNSVIGPTNADASTLRPGIYNGNSNTTDYNPLGWYSYKIVVQQKEQEYYNVYAPGALKGRLDGIASSEDNTSRIVLINDNINKVPRDLSEVGPQDKTFRSSVQLTGRVVNNSDQWIYSPPSAQSNLGNQQYYPDTRTFTTNSIQPLFDAFDWPSSGFDYTTTTPKQRPLDDQRPLFAYYNSESNPFVAEITTSQISDNQFGTLNLDALTNINVPPYIPSDQLCVLETTPFNSQLDIYYETTTSGLIKDLNTAILNDIGVSDFLNNFGYNSFNEGIKPNENIHPTNFNLTDNFGASLTPVTDYSDFSLISVFDQQSPSQDVLTTNPYFELVGNNSVNSYNVKVTQEFVNNVFYGSDQGVRRFDLTFKITLPSPGNEEVFYTEEIILANIAPEMYSAFTNPPTAGDILPLSESIEPSFNDFRIKQIYGRNGAFVGDNTYSYNPNLKEDLQWSITSVTNSQGDELTTPPFDLVITDPVAYPWVQQCQIVNNKVPPSDIKPDIYQINVQLSDPGQIPRTYALTAIYGTPPSILQEREYTIGGVTRTFLEVQFESAGTSNGFYIYTGEWSSLTQSTLGSVIIISNPTTQNSSCPGDPTSGGDWYYGGNPQSASLSYTVVKNKVASCYLGTPGTPSTGPANSIDIGSYSFEIQ